jgi:hypothetical protein
VNSLCKYETPSTCTQSKTTPREFFDVTDKFSDWLCGDEKFREFFQSAGRLLVARYSHTAEISLAKRDDSGMTLDVAGSACLKAHDGSGGKMCKERSPVECGMQVTIALFVCNTTKPSWACACKDGALTIVKQGAKLTKPTDPVKAKAECGSWFTAVSTMISMTISGFRSTILTSFEATRRCTHGELNPNPPQALGVPSGNQRKIPGLSSLFAKLDTNKDGTISKAEFTKGGEHLLPRKEAMAWLRA